VHQWWLGYGYTIDSNAQALAQRAKFRPRFEPWLWLYIVVHHNSSYRLTLLGLEERRVAGFTETNARLLNWQIVSRLNRDHLLPQ
jgi:hypothetical protein